MYRFARYSPDGTDHISTFPERLGLARRRATGLPGDDQGKYRKSVDPALSVEPIRFSQRKQRGARNSLNSCFSIGTLFSVAGCFLPSKGHRFMTLHQQIPTRASGTDRTDVFRSKALFCEERSRECSDLTSKQDWAELAMDWHAMAHLAARLTGEIAEIEVADMPISFGKNDTRICPECNNRMGLSRRMPHPTFGYDFELQTFTCRVCQHEVERSADCLGEVAG
jgi:hypothetical protein